MENIRTAPREFDGDLSDCILVDKGLCDMVEREIDRRFRSLDYDAHKYSDIPLFRGYDCKDCGCRNEPVLLDDGGSKYKNYDMLKITLKDYKNSGVFNEVDFIIRNILFPIEVKRKEKTNDLYYHFIKMDQKEGTYLRFLAGDV